MEKIERKARLAREIEITLPIKLDGRPSLSLSVPASGIALPPECTPELYLPSRPMCCPADESFLYWL